MRRIPDQEAQTWLSAISGEPDDFDWDSGNRHKNRKHGVEDKEIESLFRGDFFFAGKIVEPPSNEPRWLVLGSSITGKILALILTRRGERVRAISCRPMRRDERRIYAEALKTFDQDTD